MKRRVFIILSFFFLLNSTPVTAQGGVAQTSPIKNVIKTNILGPATGFYDINYERMIKPNKAIRVSFGLGSLSKKSGGKANRDFYLALGEDDQNDKEYNAKGISVSSEYRFFVNKESATPKGLFFSPGLQFLNVKETFSFSRLKNSEKVFEEIGKTANLLIAKALFGYQFIFKDRFVVTPYTGGGYSFIKPSEKGFGVGVMLNVGVEVGIGF